MKAQYCATCGARPCAELLCTDCGMDPRIPRELILQQAKRDHYAIGIDVAYPGETATLAAAIIVTAVLALALTLASFGVAALLIALSLVHLRTSERQLRERAVRVSDLNHPRIANLTLLAAFRLGVPAPDVYVVDDHIPNAYTSGFLGRHWVVLTSRLLELLKPEELLFVIGHELGHIRREHVSWMVLTSPKEGVMQASLRLVLSLVFTQWHQRAEFAADRAGLLACRSINTSARALICVTHWRTPADPEAIEREVLQDSTFDLSELFGDHPALRRRLRQIREFGRVAALRGQLCET